MTIESMCDRFLEGKPRSGSYMCVTQEEDTTTLSYKWGGTSRAVIAEIIRKKDSEDYTLILHPRPSGFGKTSHNNRIWGVLKSVCTSKSGVNFNWRDMRYSSHVRYQIYIEDRKLNVNYELSRPIRFNYNNGNLVIDYDALESNAFRGEEQPVAVRVNKNSNENIQNGLDRLTNILSTV